MPLAYIIGCLALIVKPGPDLMCTLATAISGGKARAATLMAGLIAGCWLWVLLLAAGVASFFTAHPRVMLAMQVAGVAYIAYLAVCTFREALAGFKGGGAAMAAGAEARGWRLVVRGILMAMSNPLTILFFLAFLPEYAGKGTALSPTMQTLLLGTVFCALVPFVYLPVIFAADFFRSRLLGSAKAVASLKLVSAAMLAAVVVILAVGAIR